MGIEPVNNQPARPTPAGEAPAEQAPVRRVGPRPSAAPGAAPAGTAPTDSVEISGRARELARARQAAEAAPDVRAELVARIKQQVESGTYEVSADLVARALLERHGL